MKNAEKISVLRIIWIRDIGKLHRQIFIFQKNSLLKDLKIPLSN